MNTQEKTLVTTYNALRRLREDTRHMIPMEMYVGMGQVLSRTYAALHTSMMQLTNDPRIEALAPDVQSEASDREIACQIRVLSGQLLTYAEALHDELERGGAPLSDAQQSVQRADDILNN
ncbi:MAG: hypothetical protein AAFN11_16805 [Chloroflexota bacterium]